MWESYKLTAILRKNQHMFHPVVAFDPSTEKLLKMDFSANNVELTAGIIDDIGKFCEYINRLLREAGCKYGIGGYGEHRTVYSRSEVFDAGPFDDEPRRLHLGVDIWGAAGTAVFAFMGGMIHSYAFNNQVGDYGSTLILLHQLDGFPFYTLYGHLRLEDIEGILSGQYVSHGQQIASFGEPHENGHWPAHLHFQIIADMQGMQGDYPGVCRFSEKERYLENCPDPDNILQLNRFVK